MNEQYINDDLLRKLAESCSPCITLVLNQNDGVLFRAQKRRVLQKLRPNLEGFQGVDPLLEPIEQIHEAPNGSLIVFRSPDVFEQVLTASHMAETSSIGDTFELRRWLPLKDSDREFYILALSLKHTRVIHCTSHSSEEVELPRGTPVSLDEVMQTEPPDHNLENKATGGQATGSMKGVMFSTSTDAEAKDAWVRHFFVQLDRGVSALFRNNDAPLVLAGVEHELAEYRRVNTHPRLAQAQVIGAPDGLRGGEMHRRALDALRAQAPEPIARLLETFDKLVGTGHASTHAQDVVKAAYEGRIAYLFVRPDAEYKGNFDEVRQKVKRNSDQPVEPRDLLNDAVIETYRHGGIAFALPADKMPNGVPVASIYRYPAPEPVGAEVSVAEV
jgi:Bacterial archaeo-eukaryotic release factor family 3